MFVGSHQYESHPGRMCIEELYLNQREKLKQAAIACLQRDKTFVAKLTMMNDGSLVYDLKTHTFNEPLCASERERVKKDVAYRFLAERDNIMREIAQFSVQLAVSEQDQRLIMQFLFNKVKDHVEQEESEFISLRKPIRKGEKFFKFLTRIQEDRFLTHRQQQEKQRAHIEKLNSPEFQIQKLIEQEQILRKEFEEITSQIEGKENAIREALQHAVDMVKGEGFVRGNETREKIRKILLEMEVAPFEKLFQIDVEIFSKKDLINFIDDTLYESIQRLKNGLESIIRMKDRITAIGQEIADTGHKISQLAYFSAQKPLMIERFITKAEMEQQFGNVLEMSNPKPEAQAAITTALHLQQPINQPEPQEKPAIKPLLPCLKKEPRMREGQHKKKVRFLGVASQKSNSFIRLIQKVFRIFLNTIDWLWNKIFGKK